MKRERIAAVVTAAPERRADEAENTAVATQGLRTRKSDKGMGVETGWKERLHRAMMAQHDAESTARQAMAERDEWSRRCREMERERDHVREERDQLVVENQRLVADITALK